jgi:antirestriction protein ArdC
MSKHAVRARIGEDRANLYDEITDKIIAELEAGRVPWVQPWGTAAAKAPLAMPKNASTAEAYLATVYSLKYICLYPLQRILTFIL